jgi:DNA-binding transcriptional ArsR family regulator
MKRHPKSRSEVVMAIVDGMVNRGWNESMIYDALINPKHRGGERIRETLDRRGEAAARREVARAYTKARAFVRRSPPRRQVNDDVLAGLAALRDEMERWPWRGIAGATDRAVLLAHLDVAERVGVPYAATNRQIAEAAGVRRQTVTKAHRRLMHVGWLAHDVAGHSGEATRWRLPRLAATSRSTTQSLPLRGGGVRLMGRSPGRDFFRWSGFGKRGAGKAAQRVFEAVLAYGPVSVTALRAVLVGLSRTRAYHHLKILADAGLIVRTGAGWGVVPDHDERSIRAAGRRGTLGATLAQRFQHDDERAAHRRARLDHARLRDDVVQLAHAAGWRSLRLGRLIVAPVEHAWRGRITQAGTKELLALRMALRREQPAIKISSVPKDAKEGAA